MIKVSVIIAVYNAKDYLRECIDSICAQTIKDIEIICVDDGSTDGSYDILLSYQNRDNRIKVMQHKEKTAGAAAARNMGMREAKGKYLSILDADDFFEPDMLEKAYENAESENADIVIFDAYIYDDLTKRNFEEGWILNHSAIPDKIPYSPMDVKDHVFRVSIGAAWNKLFNRQFVLSNGLEFESINHTDDQVFVCMAYCMADRISILDERLLHYRRNVETSQSENAYLYPEAAYMAPVIIKKRLQEINKLGDYKIALTELALDIAHWHLDRMRDWKTFKDLYYKLKDKYFEELGANDIDRDRIDKTDVDWCELVKKSTAEEYLLQNNVIKKDTYYKNIPVEIEGGSRIAIYGAGVFGKELFARINATRIFVPVNWVDRNYRSIGFPIQAIETLLDTDYDYVFVAIKNENTFNNIKTDLVKMGIEEKCIVWANFN